ncbi:MAG: hypothetical protein JNK56_17580, partial [Myxococcales bacterium]|nr:hypothetical protein [Myxococcales bacterium]
GTCIHRLDAWLAGLATARLSRALATTRRPAVLTGCIVGGYACVVDLKPVRRAAAGGHVLTPSLTHASMAALLRSGFAAYGDAIGLGVDLSSERVRLARWLFDGVRQGQGLGELLGERFERRLHQLGAADLIPAFRTAVLAGLGQPDVPPHAIVDGFVLARARRAVWQTGQGLDESERDVASKVGSVGAGRDAARTALADLDAALDALADTSLADALHGLLEGDTDRVRATLEAVDRGKAQPPTLDGLCLQRGGFAVHHEVAVLLPEAAATPGPGLAVLVAPRIDAWLAGLLRVDQRFGLLAVDPAGISPARPFQLTLAELGGGPLDLLALAPGGVLAGSPLERLLHAHLGDRGVSRDWRIDPLPPPAGVPALAELLAVVGWLQQTFARTSALGPAHLGASAGAPASLVDLGDPDDDVRHQRILERLAAITALALPGAPLPPHALAEARLVLTLLSDSARPLPAADDPGLRAWIADTAAPTLAQLRSGPATTASLRMRLGDWLPATRALQPVVAPSWLWTPTKGALCWATPAEQGPSVGQWLDLLGPTRPALGALSDVLLASEALGAPPISPLAYQSPARPRWIGLGQPPPGTRSDTRSLVVLGARPGQLVGVLSGLVIDGFTERIPETHTGGGLTFQWDAPAARAPQSILVVAPEEARGWSPDRVAAIVLDTIQLARERMVGPEELFSEPTAGLGRVLPALTLPDDIDTQPLAIAFAELFANADRITNIVPRTIRIDP